MKFVYWTATTLIAVAVALFVVANRQDVQIALTPFTDPVRAPLWAIIVAALVAAFLIGNLVGWLNASRWRRETRFLRRRLSTLERDLAAKDGQLRAAAPPPALLPAAART